MVKKSVADYVRNMLKRGYSVSSIRTVMLRSGYTDKDIDEAVNEAYHPTIRHEIHLGPTTMFVIIFALVALAGTGIYIYYPPRIPTKLLDVNLEPVTTTVEPGQSITFVKELTNLGSSARYDVVINQEILEQKTFKAITEKKETRAIETFGSTQTQMQIPQDAKPGDYVLRAIVEYDNKRVVATLPVKIIPSGKKAAAENITIECNDNNPCTEDVIENEKCVNNPIVPCCGNNICEEKETCAADCKQPEPSSGLISTETIEGIKELAKTYPSKALQQCNQIDIPDLKDTCISNIGEVQSNKVYCIQVKGARTKDICYSNIAKITKDNSVCGDITTDGIRDSCYMTFVLDFKDYSVCGSITNKQLSQSCEYLRQLNELNQKIT